MPVRSAIDHDIAFITQLDLTLAEEGGLYPYDTPRFAGYFHEMIGRRDRARPRDAEEIPDRGTKFYIIQSESGEDVGFAVTCKWMMMDKPSIEARLSERDVKLWFVGVDARYRRRGLAQEAISHVIAEYLQLRLAKDRYAHLKDGDRKLAAEVGRSANPVANLLEKHFNFEPATVAGDPAIMTRWI